MFFPLIYTILDAYIRIYKHIYSFYYDSMIYDSVAPFRVRIESRVWLPQHHVYFYSSYFSPIYFLPPTKHTLKVISTCVKNITRGIVRRVNHMFFRLANHGRGRPRITLEEIILKDPIVNYILENLVDNRVQWYRVIHVTEII